MGIFIGKLRPEPRLIVGPFFRRSWRLKFLIVKPVAAMLVANQMMISMWIADGIVVILADRSRIVACRGQRTRLLHWIGPRRHFCITEHSMFPRSKAGQQRRSCGNARWGRGIGIGKTDAFFSQAIQVRRFYMGIPINSGAVHAPLVRHEQQNIWPVALD